MGKHIEKLSDVQIRHWIKVGEPVAKSDGCGLTFTLSKGGTAAWVLRYRYAGKPRELTLGRYPDKSLTQVREEARKARASIQNGVDVAREKQVVSIERAAAKSLKQLAADYMDKSFPNLATSTVKQRRHHIDDIIIPKLGRLASREVSTADVVSLVEDVGKKSINVAELVFTAISEIFKHGIARHVVTTNPCAGISVSAICGKPEPKRLRLKLTEAELRTILPALPSIGDANALTVKILLATCVRIGELAKAEWSHVDFDKSKWFIPDANSKTGRGFMVPLTPAVIKWFKQLQVLACDSAYVLPARQLRRRQNHGGEIHYDQRALNSMLHKLCNRLETTGTPVRRFTPHDLRSTARSWLISESIGASVVVAERCLNHTLGGLLSVYDQHDYMTERRTVLERWEEFLLSCEAGIEWTPKAGNVIQLRNAAT